MLSNEEIVSTFINTNLEGDYDLLQDDLIKLATAFVIAATPAIQQAEQKLCIEIARAYNPLVADKIKEVRNKE